LVNIRIENRETKEIIEKKTFVFREKSKEKNNKNKTAVEMALKISTG